VSRTRNLIVYLVGVAATIGIGGILGRMPDLVSDWNTTAMLLAALATVGGAVLAVRHTRSRGGLDPFHPLLFPTVYVAVACLAPTAYLWWAGSGVGVARRATLSPQTPQLMALAVFGFLIGCGAPFARRIQAVAVDTIDDRILLLGGRLLMCCPMLMSTWGYLTDAVLTRGLGQNSVTLLDSVRALSDMMALAAVLLLLVARYRQDRSLLAPPDWLLVGTVIVLSGLNGRRGAALAVMLLILLFSTLRGRLTIVRTAFGVLGVVAFAYAVVEYRNAVLGGGNPDRPLPLVLLGDLASVMFTTGVTASVMSGGGFLEGSTIVAGLVRQLPGPVANALFGPPDDTGAFVFRRISGWGSDHEGYGFSLPAEGMLNFGTWGVFLVPLVYGLILAWLYSRFTPGGRRATQLMYAFAVGTLPFSIRSDVLGAVKSIFYPTVIIAIVLSLAAIAHAWRSGRRSGAPRRIPAVRTAGAHLRTGAAT
jgi:hypothetical protein